MAIDIGVQHQLLRLLGHDAHLRAGVCMPELRKGKRLVRDASLTLHRGEIVALVRPSGAGKSSLLVALALGEGTASE